MIKMEYLLNGTAPEGTTEIKCEVCGRTFAVPAGADLLIGEKICGECKAKKDAEVAAADMKWNPSTEMKTALGE